MLIKMKTLQLITLAILFAGISQAQDVMSATTTTDIGVGFSVKDQVAEFTTFVIAIGIDGGFLTEGDTVVMAPANTDMMFEYIYPYGETLDLNTEAVEFWLAKDEIQLFIDNGLEYVAINEQVYSLDKKSIKQSQELAQKVFKKWIEMP